MYSEFSTNFGDTLACYQVGYGPQEIVLIHGLGATSGFWMPLVSSLDYAKYRLTLIDIKGHGKSTFNQSCFSPSQLSIELRNVLVQVGIERCDLICHSYGGRIGLNMLLNEYSGYLGKVFVLDTYCPEFQLRPTVGELQGKRGVEFDNDIIDHCLTPSSVWQMMIANTPRNQIKKSRRLSNSEKWRKLICNEDTRCLLDKEIDETMDINKLKLKKEKIRLIYGLESVFLSSGLAASKEFHVHLDLLEESGHFFPRSQPKKLAEIIDRTY